MSSVLQKDRKGHDALVSPSSVIKSDLIKINNPPLPLKTETKQNPSTYFEYEERWFIPFCCAKKFMQNPFSVLYVNLSSVVLVGVFRHEICPGKPVQFCEKRFNSHWLGLVQGGWWLATKRSQTYSHSCGSKNRTENSWCSQQMKNWNPTASHMGIL